MAHRRERITFAGALGEQLDARLNNRTWVDEQEPELLLDAKTATMDTSGHP